jgi:hypothetical protein
MQQLRFFEPIHSHPNKGLSLGLRDVARRRKSLHPVSRS